MAEDDKLRAYAHPAFRFVVAVNGDTQAAFTECSLPAIEWETEELKEGGLNVYTHLLRGRRKAARLTLKNGVGKSELLQWYIDAMKENFTPKTITVRLLDAQLSKVIEWHIEDAYPVKWSGPQLKPDDNTIAIQSLELACGEISVEL
jgi:phage tail-like protein